MATPTLPIQLLARLPEPERAPHDLVALVQDLVKSHPEIEGLRTVLPETEEMAAVDRDLLRQALTNLVKNAHEALRDAHIREGGIRRIADSRTELVRVSLCAVRFDDLRPRANGRNACRPERLDPC